MPANDDLVAGDYGEPLPFDKNFQGPKFRNRHCTDVLFLILFGFFIAGWVYLGFYSFKHGDLNKLTVPTDSLNQKCGIDSAVLDKKYLFFFDMEKCMNPIVSITGCPTPQVCVKECPTENFNFDTMARTMSIEESKQRLICINDIEKDQIKSIEGAETAIAKQRCAPMYTKSAPLLNRCISKWSPELCKLNMILGKRKAKNYSAVEMTGNSRLSVAAAQTSDVKTQSSQCDELSEEIIKEKIMNMDTSLAKIVGNMVAHFSSDVKNAQRLGEEIVEDILNSWYIVLMALIFTLFASLLYIALMRWLSAPILWFSICGVIIGLISSIIYAYGRYQFWRDTATVPNHGLNVEGALQNLIQNSNNWLYLTIVLCIALVVVVLLILIFRSRIRLAIALTKEGSKAISSIYSTVFFPIFSWLLFVLLIAYSVSVGLHLASIGPPAFRMVRRINNNGAVTNENCICEGLAKNYTVGNMCEPKIFQQYCYQYEKRTQCVLTTCSFVQIENPTRIKWAISYNIFGFFWISFFIGAFSDMVLAATFATWYWTFKKRNVPYFTLTRAFIQTAFYHIGTLALGALVLTVCRIIRLILDYIHTKLKRYDNEVTRAILCCMSCFFWLLEAFLQFLNRNAYIMCAIHGKSFCASAKDAFNLIMRNFLRVIALNKVTDFLFFLSKILLTSGAGALTYLFVADNPEIQLHYPIVPTIAVIVAAYLITSVFFSVYSMAVDTLFLCFLEDCERNDGSAEKPYYMSKQLMRILGKHNNIQCRKRRENV